MYHLWHERINNGIQLIKLMNWVLVILLFISSLVQLELLVLS